MTQIAIDDVNLGSLDVRADLILKPDLGSLEMSSARANIRSQIQTLSGVISELHTALTLLEDVDLENIDWDIEVNSLTAD